MHHGPGTSGLKGRQPGGTRLYPGIDDDRGRSTIPHIDRKQIERLFVEAKSHLSMTRLRLRGLTGARDEFLLTAMVQNLKRLVERLAIPPRKDVAT